MIPTAILALLEQILRLINNLIEGTPMEQRRANALIWFHATWPIIKPMLPKDVQAAVEQAMASVTAAQ
jgi:hypothetical protein